MNVEQQYIDLFSQTEAMICKHSAEVLNAPRAAAFADFERLGFPTRKMEKYKYTDISKYFEPDYGLNLNRLQIPVNPYEVFKCDVPNMSTALYFVVNDAFYNKALPKTHLPEGVIFGSLKEVAAEHPELVKKFVQATKKGYEYAYSNPDDAAKILVKEAPDANLKLDFVKKSMKTIVDGQYWGDPAKIKDGSFTFGTNDVEGAQQYFDFLAQEDAYTDSHDKVVHDAPQAKDLATDEFLK